MCLANRSTIASVCSSVITSEFRMALQMTIVCASEPEGQSCAPTGEKHKRKRSGIQEGGVRA